MAPMTAFAITGAGGFIGGTLLERVRADGAEATGVDMATDKGRGIVAGDVSEPGIWAQAFSGAEIVVHTAALVTNTASRDRGWRTNVVGTRNAIDAAVSAGVSRFVHFSSVRAFGDTGFPDGVTEDHPVKPDGSVYVDTKIASEQVALQAHAAGEIEVTVIRPGDVYGPGSRPWTILPVEMIRRGRFMLPARGRGIFSPTYIDNLVDGVMLAATKEEGAGQVFTISDGIGVPNEEFFGHYHRMVGKRPRLLRTGPALGLAATAQAALKVAGVQSEIGLESMRYLTRTGTYSIEKARTVLGYEPAVDLAEGMRRTESWLREQGLID